MFRAEGCAYRDGTMDGGNFAPTGTPIMLLTVGYEVHEVVHGFLHPQ